MPLTEKGLRSNKMDVSGINESIEVYIPYAPPHPFDEGTTFRVLTSQHADDGVADRLLPENRPVGRQWPESSPGR